MTAEDDISSLQKKQAQESIHLLRLLCSFQQLFSGRTLFEQF